MNLKLKRKEWIGMSARDAGMRVPDHIKWVTGGIMNDIKCLGKYNNNRG